MLPARPSPNSRRNHAGCCQFTSWTLSAVALPLWAPGLSRLPGAGRGVWRHRPMRADWRRPQANPVYAAFWHTALVRYVDFMDNFLAPTETCHTADNFGVVLTIADYAKRSGRDFMLGVALAYTVQSRFVDHANFMTRGFDHTT